MKRQVPLLLIIAPGLVILAVLLSGCSAPAAPGPEIGSVQFTSSPVGAEVYLDHEYRGSTPVVVPAVPAGNHTAEIRGRGYERWTAPFTVTKGSRTNLTATLVSIPVTLPVTFATPSGTVVKKDLPQIHVDGYWTYAQGISSTSSPALLLVHADGFNVGYADAREVTVSANLYYEGRQVCWNTVYLGTLKTGSHVTKDTMFSCTLPSGLNSQDLIIRFENVVVTP